MKRSRTESAGWSQEEQEAAVAIFLKTLPDKMSMVAGTDNLHFTTEIPAKGVTLEALDKMVRIQAGLEFISCDFDLANNRVAFRVCKPTATSEQKAPLFGYTWQKPTPLQSGQTETQARCAALEHYAKSYLGPLTPANVQFEEVKTEATDGCQVMRVKGWRNATFEQLSVFQQMFPYHVSQVKVAHDGAIDVALQSHLRPQSKLFAFLRRD